MVKVYSWRTLQQDSEALEIEDGLALDQARWKRIIANPTPITGDKL